MHLICALVNLRGFCQISSVDICMLSPDIALNSSTSRLDNRISCSCGFKTASLCQSERRTTCTWVLLCKPKFTKESATANQKTNWGEVTKQKTHERKK